MFQLYQHKKKKKKEYLLEINILKPFRSKTITKVNKSDPHFKFFFVGPFCPFKLIFEAFGSLKLLNIVSSVIGYFLLR